MLESCCWFLANYKRTHRAEISLLQLKNRNYNNPTQAWRGAYYDQAYKNWVLPQVSFFEFTIRPFRKGWPSQSGNLEHFTDIIVIIIIIIVIIIIIITIVVIIMIMIMIMIIMIIMIIIIIITNIIIIIIGFKGCRSRGWLRR